MDTWDKFTAQVIERGHAIKDLTHDLLWWSKHPNCSAATDSVIAAFIGIAIKFDFADLLQRDLNHRLSSGGKHV